MKKKLEPCSTHSMTGVEFERLQIIMEKTAPLLADTIGLFMSGCKAAGMTQKVAASAFSLFMITNVAKVTAMSSGMSHEDIDMEKLRDTAADAYAVLMTQLGQYIVDENQKHARRN